MLTSWSTTITVGVLFIAVLLFWAWIRRGKVRAVRMAKTKAELDDASRKVKEHEAVMDVERRNLPRGVAGPRVRDVPRKKFSQPPDP